MKIPTWLQHRPVIVAENYEGIDGNYDPTETDAKGLSLGLAQWTPSTDKVEKLDISAKIWRYTGQKWSRQSEEMPLHRVLDLAILICHAQLRLKSDTMNPTTEEINLNADDKIMKVGVCEDEKNRKIFAKCLQKEEPIIKGRLEVLAMMLKQLGIAS